MVLTAAQEMHWQPWFDDPLPLRAGINPKVRLHDTIKDLNRRQLVSLFISRVMELGGASVGNYGGMVWRLLIRLGRAPEYPIGRLEDTLMVKKFFD